MSHKCKNDFSSVVLSLLSPEDILEMSKGEVKRDDTINYKNFLPVPQGPFCERIFGPTRNYRCSCGNYVGARSEGLICSNCGVLVTKKEVRRERWGHINLAVPIVNCLFFKQSSNKIATLLGMSSDTVNNIIYYRYYIIIDPGSLSKDGYKANQILTVAEYTALCDSFYSDEEYSDDEITVADSTNKDDNDVDDIKHDVLINDGEEIDEESFFNEDFSASNLADKDDFENDAFEKHSGFGENKDFWDGKSFFDFDGSKPFDSEIKKGEDFLILTGGEAIYYLLKNLDLKELFISLQKESATCSKSKKKAIKARLKLVKAFLDSKKSVENKPEWMVFKVLPVLPADLRPMTVVDGVVSSVDLNELLRRVIIRNINVKNLIERNAPEIILNNEKRFLQLAVDALIDNSKEDAKGTGDRHLKSLAEKLKGKEGRFRQNLLGKRVDYSGRSVITINPSLKIHECGLPKDMATELFLPFIVRRLLDRGYCMSILDAKNIIAQKDPVIYDILEKIIEGYPVLLNRAPTLHKMSIQAFQPKLVDGEALELNPLVCAQFNADFDGDQLGVHVPLSSEAILEANILLLSANNILREIDGEACFVPNREMTLGFYYLTMDDDSNKQTKDIVFGDFREVTIAYNNKVVDIHDKIKFIVKDSVIETTVGRVIFNSVLPADFGFVNETIDNSRTKKLVNDLCWRYKSNFAVEIIDKLKDLGFEWGHKSGISFNVDDILEPEHKKEILKKSLENVNNINAGFYIGALSDKERYSQTIDVWTKATNDIKNDLMKGFEKDENKFNSVYLMLKSGARGSEEQVRQLSGIRGLMSRSQKDSFYDSAIIETPILSSFKDGLNSHEYFISTYGGRKGMIDTALKTANAGYLTRKLVDVVQSMVVQELDCHTHRGYPIYKFEEDVDDKFFFKAIVGRISSFDVCDPVSGEVIVKKNQEITAPLAERIDKSSISCVFVRSIFTCNCKDGVCALCYGKDLSTNSLIQLGEAVGVIAAQCIGEPGTQLTLNTFHVGGVALGSLLESCIISSFDGILRYTNIQTINCNGVDVIVSKFCEAFVHDKKLNIVRARYKVPYGANMYFKEGAEVKKGDKLFDWDQYFYNVLSRLKGEVVFENFKDNVVLQEVKNNETKEVVIRKIKNNNTSFIVVKDSKGNIARYNLTEKAHILVADGQKINVGDVIFKIARNINKSSDITGGLPRVTELLEAKNDPNAAILSDIDGFVSLGSRTKKKIEVIVSSKDNVSSCTYLVPLSMEIVVQEGEYIKVGSPITKGSVNIHEIFKTQGFYKASRYIIHELKKVYELQGVFIDNKHFEMIINQMFSMVEIINTGDTDFISSDVITLKKFNETNKELYDKYIVTDSGSSTKYNIFQLVSSSELILENIYLKNNGGVEMKARKAVLATARVVLRGISQVSLNTEGWISAASFQSTISVLSSAAIASTEDDLLGLKENLIVGHKVPCGTNFSKFVENDCAPCKGK